MIARSTQIAYFDPIAGASGNMLLGALLDAGLAQQAVDSALKNLPLGSWTFRSTSVLRGTLGATLLEVVTEESSSTHRSLPDILRIIDAGGLSARATNHARAVFMRLADAEARVHRIPVDRVHFHEVGALDAIVDICGVCVALDLLGIEQIHCGPLPLGGGHVHSAHGILPLPAPATLALIALTGAQTVPHDATVELVTPTGAALLTTLASFTRPSMCVTAIGYGAGTRIEPEPNVLRVVLGARDQYDGDLQVTYLTLLECNIDDMNPQWYGHLFERLLASGALDVTSATALMKKGRPGQILSVLCTPETENILCNLLLQETTTLGVRSLQVKRIAARRAFAVVETEFGSVRVKMRILHGLINAVTPEFDDCRKLAERAHVPLSRVTAAAQSLSYSYIGRAAGDIALVLEDN